jgi:hypothetical protein
MKIHPAADMIPAMTDAEYEALKADIQAHGLHVPIETLDGMILDGRHRYRACTELGKPHEFLKQDLHSIGGCPYAYVWSVNAARRHLSISARAMLAVKIKEAMAGEAETRKKAGKKTSEQNCLEVGASAAKAAKAVGVSTRTVIAAAKVQADGAKAVIAAVNNETLPVSAAEKIVRENPKKADQEKALKNRISGGVTFDVKEIEAAEDDTPQGRMEAWNKAVDAFARSITALASTAPVGGWWDANQAGIVKQQLKSAAGSARQAKCDNICPKCNGKGCKWCKGTGFMPKRSYEMAGGK